MKHQSGDMNASERVTKDELRELEKEIERSLSETGVDWELAALRGKALEEVLLKIRNLIEQAK